MEKSLSIEYIKQAFSLKEDQLYKPAIEMLYKALEIENDNVEILCQIGELYFLLNNYSRALQYLEHAVQHDPKHTQSLKLIRTIKLRQQDYDKALELSQKLYEINPEPSTLKDLTSALINLKLFDEIEAYYNSEHFTTEVKIDCANALYKNGDIEKAKTLLENCPQEDENVLLLNGRIKFDESDFTSAAEIFNKISKNTQNPEILNFLGLFDLENMNFIEAIKNFSKAVNLDKNNARYCYNLASAYFYNGWTDEAQKAYLKALYIDPENLDYRYSLAYLYFDKKDFVKANKEVKAILGIDPNHSQTRVLKALLLAQNNNLIEAKNILEENLKKGYDDDFTKISLSKIYTELNIFNKAQEIINEVIKNNPQNLNYLCEQAEIYIKEKNYDSALKIAEKILELNPNYIAGAILGAKTAWAKQDLELTRSYAQDIISLDMNCSEGYYYLALARLEEGDTEEAIECMKRAILYDLNNAKYYQKMSEIYKMKKDYQTALQYISEAQALDDSNELKFIYSELVKLSRKSQKK